MEERGAKPPSLISSPSPFKERGIQGVRLLKIVWGFAIQASTLLRFAS